MDDIGLETLDATPVLEMICEQSPLHEKPIDPKVDPITVDPDLQTVIDAWPKLSDTVRRMIINSVLLESSGKCS